MSKTPSQILIELQTAIQHRSDWSHLAISKAQNIHIAVMSEPFLSFVFEGKKTVESRFSLNRITPYNKVEPGDVVFMKAGHVVGYFTVSWATSFDLQEYPIAKIAQKYGSRICGDEVFWNSKSTKRYATLIGIENIQKLTPITITKHDRRAWLTISQSPSETSRILIDA